MSEKELAEAVQEARNALQGLLTAGEWETRRTSGSEYPETFEDAAREIATYDLFPRCMIVGEALATYQLALNALLEHAVLDEVPKKLAGIWHNKRCPALGDRCATYDEVLEEATWATRRAAGRYDPGRGTLFAYAYTTVMHALDLWWGRQQVPVEVSEKLARTGEVLFQRLESHDGDILAPSKSIRESEDYATALLDYKEELEQIARDLGVPVEELI